MNKNLTRLCSPDPNINTYFNLIRSTFESGIFTQGSLTKDFELRIRAIAGAKASIFTANGTVSLSIGLIALGIKPGDIVLTTPYSFVASSNAIASIGALPIFIDHCSINIDVDAIRKFIEEECIIKDKRIYLTKKMLKKYHHRNLRKNSQVKALLVVDQFGLPCEFESILNLAKEYNLAIMRDAACAIGSKLNKISCLNPCGYDKSLASVSFHPRKIITTGEGGMIVVNEINLTKKIQSLVNHGIQDKESCYISSNARNSELSAALGITHLSLLRTIIDKRKVIWKQLAKALPTGCFFPEILPGVEWNLQSLPLICRNSSKASQIHTLLTTSGIACKLAIKPINTLLSYQKYTNISCKMAAELSTRTLLLPCHESMTEEDTEVLISYLEKC